MTITSADSLSELRATDPPDGTVFLTEAGRSGMFKRDDSDLSDLLVDRTLEVAFEGGNALALKTATTTTVSPSLDTAYTGSAHGLDDGDRVYALVEVCGLLPGECYAVVNATSTSFQLARSPGGTPIDLTNTTNFTVRQHHRFRTGDVVAFDTTGGGIEANTRYFAIVGSNPRTFEIAASRADAYAGTAVELSGGGSCTVYVLADPCEGLFVIRSGKSLMGDEGALRRLTDDSHGFNVRWFGAVGDNATNDHPAIQGAVNMARRWGGRIRFPSGSYVVDDKIIINGTVHLEGEVSGVQFFPHGEQVGQLVGASNYLGSWIRLADGAALARGWTTSDARDHGVVEIVYDNPVYGGGYTDNRRFASMTYIGVNGHAGPQHTSTKYSGILVKNAWHTHIVRCAVVFPRGHGIAGVASAPYNSLNNALIKDSWFFGNMDHGTLAGIFSIWGDSQVIGNHCYGWQNGIEAAGGGTSFIANKIEGNVTGVRFSSAAKNWVLSGNMIYDNQKNGVYVSGVANTDSYADAIGAITGNSITQNGRGTNNAGAGRTVAEGAGIFLVGSHAGLTICGNTLGNPAGGWTQTWGTYANYSGFVGTCSGNGYLGNSSGNDFRA